MNSFPIKYSSKHFAKEEIERAIKEAFSEFAGSPRAAIGFRQLLEIVRERTRLLRPGAHGKCPDAFTALFVIRRLKNFAHHHEAWLRPWFNWNPQTQETRPALRDLAAHLVARFPTPAFLDSVWDSKAAHRTHWQSWFISLARGASIRSLELPIPLTQRMQHLFRNAPDHLDVIQAIRHAEVVGLGGSQNLAYLIAETFLGEEAEEPIFWRTVLQFFVAQPELKPKQIRAILDFVYVQKFAREEILTANGPEIRGSVWPAFEMEGRTPNSLLRLVEKWSGEAHYSENDRLSWKPSGIRPHRFVEKRPNEPDREWNIVELLNSAALNAEARAMRHCVSIYDYDCLNWGTSIWSLRLRIGMEEKRIATIEVDKARKILQMKSKANGEPRPYPMSIIRKWARSAGLEFPRSR